MGEKTNLEGMWWENDTLHTNNDTHRKNAHRKWMSYSVMSSVLKCPASHLGEQNLPWVSDPLSPTELGTKAHIILEDLYQLPPIERTIENATSMVHTMADEIWDNKHLAEHTELAFKANTELKHTWTQKVSLFVTNVFKMEHPQHVNVIGTEYNLKGVELEQTGGPIVGQIDRVDQEPDGTITIGDYKSGKYNDGTSRFGDSHSDQLHLYYAGYTKETGTKPAHAKVLYIADAKTRTIQLSDEHATKVMHKMRDARNILQTVTETGAYPATPNNLCGWCKIVNTCPVANLKTDKAKNQAATAPDAEKLKLFPQNHTKTVALTMKEVERSTEKEKQPMLTQTPRPEAPAYDELIGDKLNLNSFAAGAINDLATFATGHLDIHGQPLTETTITTLTQTLAYLVQTVEYQIAQQTSWQRGANQRARTLVKQAIITRPAPFGAAPQEWDEWLEKIVALSLAMFKAAITVYQNDEPHQKPNMETLHTQTSPSSKGIPA